MNLCSPAPCNIPWHLWPRSLFWQRHRMLQIPRWGQRTPSLEPCTAEGHPFPSIWKSGTFINHLARNLKPAHWMIGLQWNIAHCGTLSFWDEARCLVGKRHMFGPKTIDTTGRAEFVISREKRNSVKQLTKPRKVSCKIPPEVKVVRRTHQMQFSSAPKMLTYQSSTSALHILGKISAPLGSG